MGKYIILFLIITSITDLTYSQSHYELGYKEYLDGNIEKSVTLFTNAINEKQNIAKAYMMRGMANGYLNDFYHAIEDLNSSKKIDSSNYYLFYCYGKVYVLNGVYNKGLEYLNLAIELHKEDEYVYDYRAATKTILEDYEGAIKDENIAIQINSKVDYFYNARGFAYTGLKKYKEAIKDYDMALKLEKNHTTYANKGYTYYLLGDYDVAVENYTYSLNINPNDYEILYRRALAYQSLKKYDMVCSDLKKSAELEYNLAIELKKEVCDN